MKIKQTTIVPEMCECGRLYKDRRDETGKMLCSACYTGLSIEDLKKLWETPVNNVFTDQSFKDIKEKMHSIKHFPNPTKKD